MGHTLSCKADVTQIEKTCIFTIILLFFGKGSTAVAFIFVHKTMIHRESKNTVLQSNLDVTDFYVTKPSM